MLNLSSYYILSYSTECTLTTTITHCIAITIICAYYFKCNNIYIFYSYFSDKEDVQNCYHIVKKATTKTIIILIQKK